MADSQTTQALRAELAERDRELAALRARVAELETDRQTLDALMALVPEGLVVVDAPAMTLRLVNGFARQHAGEPFSGSQSTPTLGPGEPWEMYYPDGVTRAAPQALPLHRAALGGEEVSDEEWVLARPNGERVPVLCSARPIRDQAGRISGGVMAWRDLRAIKQADALRLAERQERDRLLAAVQDQASALQWANERLEERAQELEAQLEEQEAQAAELRTQHAEIQAANQALSESKERWRVMVESLAGPLIIYDAAGRATFSNLDARHLPGERLSGDRTISQHATHFRLEHPDGRPFEPGELPVEQAIARDTAVRNVEVVRRSPGGLRRTALWSAAPLHDPAGRVIGAMAIAHDVTEERRAAAERERLLAENRRQRELLEKLIETAPAGILVLSSPELRVRQINPSFRQLLDKPLRDASLTGLTLQELLPHAEEGGLAHVLRQVAGGGQAYFNPEYEYTGFRPRAIYWRLWALPLDAGGARCLDVMVLALDITEQVLARRKVEALADEIERRRQILDQILSVSPDQFYLCDRDGRYLYANHAAARALGLEQPQIIGKTGNELSMQARVMAAFDAERQQVFITGQSRRGEVEFPLVDGPRYYEYVLSPAQGETMVATVRDITEHRQAETSLRKALARLSERETELRQARDDLEQRVQERTARLQFFHQVDQAILAAQALAPIARVAVDHIGRAVPCTQVNVFLFEGEPEGSRLLATSDPRSDLAEVIDRGTSVGWRLMPRLVQGEAGVVEDLEALADLNPVERTMLAQGSRSYFSVPLLVGGRCIGGIAVWSATTGAPPPEHLGIIRQVADSLAVAIHNARLFEQVQASRQQLQVYARRLVEAVENERRIIARELHDEASQALTALGIGLGMLEKDFLAAGLVNARLDELKQTVQNVQEGLHDIAINLRPFSLDRYGLLPAVTQYVESYRLQTGQVVDLVSVGFDDRPRLEAAIETSLYRLVQEALTNVARHAQAGHVGVVLEWVEDLVTVIVEDDGVGFDLTQALRSNRLGLLGMRERTEMLGGSFTLESHPGKGTTLFVQMPARPPDPASP